MPYDHALVWIDHHHAHIIYLDAHSWAATNIDRPGRKPHQHGARATGRSAREDEYFRSICRALALPSEIIVVGPSSAKTEFMKFLASEAPATASRVLAVEHAANANEMELVDHARAFFSAADITPPPALR